MTLTLKDINPIFSHDTPADDCASPYHVRLLKVQQIGRYGADGQSLKSMNLDRDLDLEHCDPVCSQASSLWYR